MQADCDRCLEPAEFPIDSDFDLFYRPAKRPETQRKWKLMREKAEVAFYEGGGMELKDILREHVLLCCRCSGFAAPIARASAPCAGKTVI